MITDLRLDVLQRINLINEVYETALTNTNTFRGALGTSLLYLLGAIGRGSGTVCQFTKNESISRFLRAHFQPDHSVWSFVVIGAG